MKYKEITLGGSYTYQPAAYHAIRGEATIVVELQEDDDLAEIQGEVRRDITAMILRQIAEVDENLHGKLYNGGITPLGLLQAAQNQDEDKDDDWGL